ncbi:hypothetical protein [Streptomyces sp. NPDC090022]|uniref:hypothetical protein n=1 Tax=Streptomyces sp. NPDC090022 TaxID=3365920 RepID=UPI0037F698FD
MTSPGTDSSSGAPAGTGSGAHSGPGNSSASGVGSASGTGSGVGSATGISSGSGSGSGSGADSGLESLPGSGFRPTHIVPREGLPAWEAPDVTRPTVPLDAFLPVQLLARRGEWAEILCANGWSAWVDGRLLISVPAPPPGGAGTPARTEDPRPLLARSAEALARYRRAADDLAAGRADGEAFRRGTRGLRAGVVVDGESVWLYDEAGGRWMYGDGQRLSVYAVAAVAGGPGSAEHERDPVPGAPEPAGAAPATAMPAATAPGDPAAAAPAGPARPPAPDTAPATGDPPPPPHEPTRIVRPGEFG